MMRERGPSFAKVETLVGAMGRRGMRQGETTGTNLMVHGQHWRDRLETCFPTSTPDADNLAKSDFGYLGQTPFRNIY